MSTWKALHGEFKTPGWRSIDLFQTSSCRVKLARHSPSNHEALLVTFPNTKLAPTSLLPKGKGFRMERANLGEGSDAGQWLAIVKQPAGCIDLFAAVVADIAERLSVTGDTSTDLAYQDLMGRVRGWQEFMRQGREGLSREAEQGLVGELVFLDNLMQAGLPSYSALESWKGPSDGLHDFIIGIGAIEVKSSIGNEGFLVRISSLAQLDDSHSSPLYLAALRLRSSDQGLTLNELIAETRTKLTSDRAALNLFEKALFDAGYLDMHADNYIRKFQSAEFKVLLVDSTLPRLTNFNTPPAITWAQYEIDLSSVTAPELELPEILEKLGVI
nr:PD-(D/E)XK motif protein [Pseudomonas peradeniyensis]